MSTEIYKDYNGRIFSTTYRLKQLKDFCYMFKDEIHELVVMEDLDVDGFIHKRNRFIFNIAIYFLNYSPSTNIDHIWKPIRRNFLKLPDDYKIKDYGISWSKMPPAKSKLKIYKTKDNIFQYLKKQQSI